MNLKSVRASALIAAAALSGGAMATAAATSATASTSQINFPLVRSAGSVAAGCLTSATAAVKVKNQGPVDVMTIDASGLPKNTDFDVFVTQLPNAPFGISWYQGDLESDSTGHAHGQYIGRFSVETFAVAPGTGPAPAVFPGDATTNPAFKPVQMYHIGVWFNSAKSAVAAHCANSTTPFNGEHNAGPQALSTRQFAATNGPLRQLNP